MSEDDILNLIREDGDMMDAVEAVQSLSLPDWIIGAGFVRNKVWDDLHGYDKKTPLNDIDVIYFDRKDFSSNEANAQSTKKEIEYQKKLVELMPGPVWSVTNQARMHHFHKRKPYVSSEEGLSEWVETATCIGVTLENEKLRLIVPHGIDDLVNLLLVPTITTKERIEVFNARIKKKDWLEKWPGLRVKIKD